MPVPFIMPKFDMDQETGTVVEWLKNEGDPVAVDEPVLVIETEKVSIDVPAPAAGVLASIRVKPGDVVPVTTVIAYILAEGESMEEVGVDHQLDSSSPDSAKDSPSTQKLKTRATPVATRMARQLGIDLAGVAKESHKVYKNDILRHLERMKGLHGHSNRVEIPATPAARRLASHYGLDIVQARGTGPRGRVQANDVEMLRSTVESPTRLTTDFAGERIPLVGPRLTIAERMQNSFHDIPHIALSVEVDTTWLEATRLRLNTELEAAADGGPVERISLTTFLVKAVSWALIRHPYLNSSIINDEIYLWQPINIGVATAIDTGLMVPVIHHANRLSIKEMNSKLRDLVRRAQSGDLTLQDVKGGTFTLSNLGMFGIQQFRAIINPPESGILAVGKVIRRPIVLDDSDTIEIRPMMNLTLSADHRIVDGVTAAKFLADVIKCIQAPDLLLF